MRIVCPTNVGLLIALALTGAANAQTEDSPYYKGWSGWRDGATATTKTEVESAGAKMSSTATATLKKVAADKAVVELALSFDLGGQKQTSPAAATDVLAKMPTDPKAKKSKGKETLTINGKKLECEWIETEVGGDTTRTWFCPDVPGGVVKETIKSADSTTTSQVVEWKGEKK